MEDLVGVLRLTPSEYNEMCGDDEAVDDIRLLDGEVVEVIVSDCEECPFTVTKYSDGRYAVVGLGFDHEICEEDIRHYVCYR